MTTYKIPDYLDNIIFGQLGAIYQKCNNVDVNLYNDDMFSRIYLGTYFPRSCAESNLIFSELFKCPEIKTKFSGKNNINILDIGSGCGGNLTGLLLALNNIIPKYSRINIISVDGNRIALDCQIKIINNIKNKLNRNIIFKEIEYKFNYNIFKNELISIIRKSNINKFDIIMSFKFFSEFYNIFPYVKLNLFNSFSELCSDLLNDIGLSVLLDVTTKDKRLKRNFTPFIMSKEISNFLKNNPDKLRCILPLSCAFWFKNCSGSCFFQDIIKVSHSKKMNDVSKVCYYVFTKPAFAESVLSKICCKDSYNTSYKSNNSGLMVDGRCSEGKHERIRVFSGINAFKFS